MTKRRRILHADKIIQNVFSVFCLLMFLQLKGYYSLSGNPILLYSTTSDIRVSVNGEINTIVEGLKQGSAVDFLHNKDLVCWSDTADLIQCMNYNESYTSEKIRIVSDNLITPTGLAIDWYTNKIYWTDGETNRVEVIGIYERYRKVLYWSDVDLARAIAVVPQQGLMFWTDWGEVPKIERAGMNGDPSTRKIIVKDKIIWPNGITVDYNNKLIYWVDAKLKFIDVMDFNGEKRKRVIKMGLEYPYALTLFSDKLFWTDWKNWSINSWDMSTSGPIKELIKSKPVPVDIKIYDSSRQVMPDGDYPCRENNGGCSHLCLLSPAAPGSTMPGYNCICPTGVKLMEGSTTTCYSAPQSLVLVAQRSSISKISLDTPDYTPYSLPLKDLKRTLSVDFDPKTEFIYWADSVAKTISRARLDGSEQSTVLRNIGVPDSIALDPLARNIYWSDRVTDTITVAKMDGSSKKVIIHDELYDPRAIALHPTAGLMFWSDWNDKKPKIERANLDGSDRKMIVTEKVMWPNCIALDTVNNKLYWGDAWIHKIEVCNLDGTERQELYNTDIKHIFGLTLLGDYLYWTDMQKRTLERVNRYNVTDMQTLVEQIPNVMGVKVVGVNERIGSNPCVENNGGCSHLCFNRPSDYVCSCPLGLELGPDRKKCFEPDAFLLYGRKNVIGVLSIYSENNTEILPVRDVKEVSALALHVPGSKLYWSDSKTKSINRCSMDGSNTEKILDWTGLVEGLAIDYSGQNIYWTDTATQRIEVSRLDGSSRRTLIWQGLKKPKSIVLDPKKGFMYWSELGSKSIKRASMDGSSPTILFEQVGRVYALTIDYETRSIYWATIDPPTIEVANLNGTGRRTVVDSVKMPYALAVYGDRLYWGDWNTGLVSSAYKTNGSSRVILHKSLDYISELRIHPRGGAGAGAGGAAGGGGAGQCAVDNGGCAQLCLSTGGDYRCACAAHYKLEKDNVTCAEPEEFLLFAQKSAIGRVMVANGECADAFIPLAGLKTVKAIEYDPISKLLYWMDEDSRSIRRVPISYSFRSAVTDSSVIVADLSKAFHMVLDVLGRALYWTCYDSDSINVTSIDKNISMDVIVRGEKMMPRHLAFHQTKRFLIWNDVGHGAIMRSNVDGMNAVELAKTSNVTALTVDQTSSTVYWAVNRQIHAVELDGSNKRIIWQGGFAGTLSAYSGSLYFAGGERSLMRIPLHRKDAPAAPVPHIARLQALLAVHKVDSRHGCYMGGGCGSRWCGAGGTCGGAACPRGHFACAAAAEKHCLPDHYRCDGQADCADGSDEGAGCACAGGVRCVDGTCADSAASCRAGARCRHHAPDAFRCDENLCLAADLLCDDHPHCEDGTDESPATCGDVHRDKVVSAPRASSALAACGAAGGAAACGVLLYAVLRRCRRAPPPPAQLPLQPPKNRLSPLGASQADSFSTDSTWSRVPLNPPPSPASWAGGGSRAGGGGGSRCAPRPYRCITRVPPPTPASTDAGDSEPDAPPPSPVYTQ